MRIAAYIVAFVAMAAAIAWMSSRVEDQRATALKGKPRITDGDSVTINSRRIRLIGIDAPELDQPCTIKGEKTRCGRLAREHLVGLVAGRTVTCEGEVFDKYARLLAVCKIDELELNRRMVADGWAVSYGRYKAEEAAARNRRAGLWDGRFEPPQAWRAWKRRKPAWWDIFGWFT